MGPGSPLLADRSDLTRVRATGRDALDLLHRLSTQDLKGLAIGEGRPTVVTTPKGRILERLFVHRLAEREVLLVGGVRSGDPLLAHLRRFVFREDVAFEDVTGATVHWAFLASGPVPGLSDPGAWGARPTDLGGVLVTVLGHDGFSADGRSVVAPVERREEVRDRLTSLATPIDAAALEVWRISRGHPVAGAELTEEYNPLEAGLLDHVSFTKGCYVGQEVVARLNTYGKVSRRIVGLELAGTDPPAPGAAVTRSGAALGRVTSAAVVPGSGRVIALAYVKGREASTGGDIAVASPAGTVPARLLELPFPVTPS